jgi:hypothetical protein
VIVVIRPRRLDGLRKERVKDSLIVRRVLFGCRRSLSVQAYDIVEGENRLPIMRNAPRKYSSSTRAGINEL